MVASSPPTSDSAPRGLVAQSGVAEGDRTRDAVPMMAERRGQRRSQATSVGAGFARG